MTTMMPRRTPQMLNWKKKKEQNFEGEANNKLLDEEDTQRSNLNGKYLSFTLVLKFWFSGLFLMCSIL